MNCTCLRCLNLGSFRSQFRVIFSKNVNMCYYLWLNMFVNWLMVLLCLTSLKPIPPVCLLGKMDQAVCSFGTRFPLTFGLNFHMQLNRVFIQATKYTDFIILHMRVKWIIMTETEPTWVQCWLAGMCMILGHCLMNDLQSRAIWVACAGHICVRIIWQKTTAIGWLLS